MALEGINTAQFDVFTAIAIERLAGKIAQSIVRLGTGGALHIVKAANPRRRGAGMIGHAEEERAANNEVNEKFRKAVASLFGGEERIPDNVKKAMRSGDCGQGKPLTVRHIDAVRQAVERHFADYPAEFAAAKANASEAVASFGEQAVDAAIAAGVSAVTTDADAAKLVAWNIDRFIVREGSKLRDPEEIREMAQALRACVVELRAAATGAPKAFEAGLRFLDRLGGKALPPGVFTAIFNAAHAASAQAPGNADAILAKSGAAAALDGPAEQIPCREFIDRLLAGKGAPQAASPES